MKQYLLEDYESALPGLLAIEAGVMARLHRLLGEAGLNVHSLSSRIKAPDSLARKLMRPDRTYHELRDVTDLIGARIITY
ncbi:MAG: GTP pyrophosphokinase family protein, partial [Candidatus Sericytochromatia bacterium]